MKRSPCMIAFSLLALLVSLGLTAQAAAQSKDDMQKRFEERYADIVRLKRQGKVGETAEGYIEAVLVMDSVLARDEERLIERENDDRRALYRLIADDVVKGERRVPPQVVGRRNAKRNFEKAKPEEYLKTDEARWIQKQDERRFDRIARLKREGRIGETHEGYLEAIESDAGQVKSLINEENEWRRSFYRELSRKAEDTTAEKVAQAAAREVKQGLPPGHSFKDRDGEWERQPGDDRNGGGGDGAGRDDDDDRGRGRGRNRDRDDDDGNGDR